MSMRSATRFNREVGERLEHIRNVLGMSQKVVADLENAGWVRLPVDADGEVIHVGDELDVGFVARIVITDDEWPSYLYAYKETPHILTQHFCNEVSHHHEPTVEDVLREFAEKVIDSQIPSVHPTYEEAIAEFAAKLRLADDGGEQ